MMNDDVVHKLTISAVSTYNYLIYVYNDMT